MQLQNKTVKDFKFTCFKYCKTPFHFFIHWLTEVILCACPKHILS